MDQKDKIEMKKIYKRPNRYLKLSQGIKNSWF